MVNAPTSAKRRAIQSIILMYFPLCGLLRKACTNFSFVAIDSSYRIITPQRGISRRGFIVANESIYLVLNL